jgi:predicted esterase
MTTATIPATLELSYEHVYEPGDPARTLLLLHSTGGDEHQLLALGRQLAPEATIVSPRGKELEGGAVRRFFRRHGTFDLDIDDLREKTDDLADFLTAAAGHYGFQPQGVTALGYSNGANIAVNMLLQRPETLSGAVLLRPMLTHEPASVPDLNGKRVLVMAGRHDPFSPPEQTARLIELLRGAGADVSARIAAAGHQARPDELGQIVPWLQGRR